MVSGRGSGARCRSADIDDDVMVFEHNVAVGHHSCRHRYGSARRRPRTGVGWSGSPTRVVRRHRPERRISSAAPAMESGSPHLRLRSDSLPSPGRVNDLVVRLASDAPARRRPTRGRRSAQIARIRPVAATITTRDDDVGAYHLLYQDIEGDQKVWNAVSTDRLPRSGLRRIQPDHPHDRRPATRTRDRHGARSAARGCMAVRPTSSGSRSVSSVSSWHGFTGGDQSAFRSCSTLPFRYRRG